MGHASFDEAYMTQSRTAYGPKSSYTTLPSIMRPAIPPKRNASARKGSRTTGATDAVKSYLTNRQPFRPGVGRTLSGVKGAPLETGLLPEAQRKRYLELRAEWKIAYVVLSGVTPVGVALTDGSVWVPAVKYDDPTVTAHQSVCRRSLKDLRPKWQVKAERTAAEKARLEKEAERKLSRQARAEQAAARKAAVAARKAAKVAEAQQSDPSAKA